MAKASNIDRFFESTIMWATTGRICEDVYFRLRHCYFRILAALNPKWLPFVRQAEKELKSYQQHLRPRYTWREWWGLGLRRPLFMLFFPVALIVFLTFSFDFPLLVPDFGDSSALIGILKTTGAILATLTAILLAVTALAIQTTLANLPGAGFLVGPFARRQGFIPVAALLFGTLVSIIAGVIFADVFREQTLNDWVLLATFSAFVSVLLLFDLLRRTLQGLGDTDVATLLGTELTNKWRIHTHEAFRLILIEIHLRKELAKLGFERQVCSEGKETEQQDYHLRKAGCVATVDTAPLRKIARLLQTEETKPNLDLYRLGCFGMDSPDVPCITIPEDGDITPEKSLALLLPAQSREIGEDDVTWIDHRVQNAFVLGRTRRTYFNWQTLYSVLLQAVDNRDIVLTKASLDTFQALLGDHASVFAKFVEKLEAMDATPPGDFNMNHAYHFSPPHPFELNLSDLAIRASQNNSSDCLDEILNSIYRIVCMCFKWNERKSFRDVLFEFYGSYRASSASPNGGTPSVAAAVMRRLPWVANEIGLHLFEHENSLGRWERVRDFSMPYYSLCLQFLRCASERSDEKMANSVLDDLDHFLKQRIPKNPKRLRDARTPDGSYPGIEYGLHARSPQEQGQFVDLWSELHDYRSLVYVIAGAWLSYRVRENKLAAEELAPFIGKLVDVAPDFRDLLDLYAMPGMGGMTSATESPLGYEMWDWPDSPYSSGRSGTDFQRWIKPFYAFLLFKKAARGRSQRVGLEVIRCTDVANHDSLKRFLADITSEGYSLPAEYQNAPWGMKAEDISKAKKHLAKVLGFWERENATPDDGTGGASPKG